MIAGIMQPYFFPYIGYFDLIYRADVWVVFDIVQFQPKNWMSRNRMLHPTQGWQYIIVELAHKTKNSCIAEIILNNATTSNEKIIRQLRHYSKKAPYYDAVMTLIQQAFANRISDTLVDMNIAGLYAVCAYLKISFAPIIASKQQWPLPPVAHAGQWALEICTLLDADTYINAPGGRGIFRPEEFKARGIRLGFTPLSDFTYDCTPYIFEPRLSILDVLMWNSPETVREYLGTGTVDYVA